MDITITNDDGTPWNGQQPFPKDSQVGILLKDMDGRLKKRIQEALKNGEKVFIVSKKSV